jgi:Ran GTPase-activating protein (RanGAP) involved in mRNA processing and transport
MTYIYIYIYACIGNKVAIVLANCIEKLPYLQLLDLTDNNLSDEGLSVLLLSIAKHQTLNILDISQNVIGPDSASALASYVSYILNIVCGIECICMMPM